jgi:hypothetical protein
MRRLAILIVSLGLLLGWRAPGSCPAVPVLDNFFLTAVRAQAQARAVLYPADASAFPIISTFMDVFDASGRFVSGLQPQQVTVFEDGQPVAPEAVTEMIVPMQLTVAVSPGPALAVRDGLGKERFQSLVEALSAWAQALPADTPDDMSLVTLSGPIISHASARDWLVSLQAFRPDFRDTTPNLQTLQIAIETIAVPPPRIGMKRAVLFITPHMDDPDIDAKVAPLIERAVQNGVRVFVWFADSELYTATASAIAFNNLAVQTGGAYFAATELQPYPDPEIYFAPLRRLYALQYLSPATTGGSHTVSVEVTGQAGSVRTADQAFTIDLQPPNPIFVTPPLQLHRSPPEDDPFNTEILLPAAQPLEIVVEFPDGHPRPLVRTTLYVDNQIVAENTAEPFDAFAWDLTAYTETAEHKLVVEAVDSLGLNRTSIEVPVTVTVVQPPRGLPAFFGRYRDSIILGAVIFAGVALVFILFFGKLRTLFAGARSVRFKRADPVTQPLATAADIPTVASASADTTRRGRAAATAPAAIKPAEAPALLRTMQPDPLAAPGETFKPASVPPIPLAAREITFGTDPKQANHVLHDPSLEPRHARITRTENGDFFVVDAGTIGGTWVNFEPVGQEAHLLRHGDVLHFGQVVFRFELKEPPEPAQPKVTRISPVE